MIPGHCDFADPQCTLGPSYVFIFILNLLLAGGNLLLVGGIPLFPLFLGLIRRFSHKDVGLQWLKL